MSSIPERPTRKSTRLKDYNYAQNGAYFVTVCTQKRECLFGNVVEGDMQLNAAGKVVHACWASLAAHYSTVELDAVVLMPNHLHAIVFIHEADGQQKPSLQSLLQWFKIMSTNAYIRGVRAHGWDSFPGKLWQRSFYDHIVRSEHDLNTHRQYILENPARWASDEHYLP